MVVLDRAVRTSVSLDVATSATCASSGIGLLRAAGVDVPGRGAPSRTAAPVSGVRGPVSPGRTAGVEAAP